MKLAEKNDEKSTYFTRLLYQQKSFVPEGLVAHSQIQVHSRAAFLNSKSAFDLIIVLNR